jgi:hypothetical protein
LHVGTYCQPPAAIVLPSTRLPSNPFPSMGPSKHTPVHESQAVHEPVSAGNLRPP